MYLSIYINIIWETDYVIYNFSKILFNICYNFIPIILLSLPIIFNKCFNKIMSYLYIINIMYIPILLIINLSITIYMKNFTLEKWYEKSIHLRHLMIEDFENEYKTIGKDKNEITKILGNYAYINEECICYDIRLYKDIVYDTYCLYYNKDNIITNTSKTWENIYKDG